MYVKSDKTRHIEIATMQIDSSVVSRDKFDLFRDFFLICFFCLLFPPSTTHNRYSTRIIADSPRRATRGLDRNPLKRARQRSAHRYFTRSSHVKRAGFLSVTLRPSISLVDGVVRSVPDHLAETILPQITPYCSADGFEQRGTKPVPWHPRSMTRATAGPAAIA